MGKIKSLLHSKKLTIILGIIAIVFGIALYFAYFAKLGSCYSVYSLTYVPSSYNLSQVRFNKTAEQKNNCSSESVRFVNGEPIDWIVEQRHAEAGPKTYRFDIAHMDFLEENGRKYTFITDRNKNPALIGFIENTFVFINNENGQKLSREDMVGMFNGLTKK